VSYFGHRRCNTCGEYIYKGKKFNARKETVDGEDYYGIKIFRFYIKWCVVVLFHILAFTESHSSTLCSAEITFKTDPKNTDYSAEHGASRNFEPWREERVVEEEDRLARLEEEENNPMKALENRTVDAKREMDILDALQDIRARNARNERVGQASDLVSRMTGEEEETEEEKERRLAEEEDEMLVREVFSKVSIPALLGGSSAAADTSGDSPTNTTSPQLVTIKRKADDVEPDLRSLLPESTRVVLDAKSLGAPPAKKSKSDLKNKLGIKIAKKGKVAV
jgi:hypothetical protein